MSKGLELTELGTIPERNFMIIDGSKRDIKRAAQLLYKGIEVFPAGTRDAILETADALNSMACDGCETRNDNGTFAGHGPHCPIGIAVELRRMTK